MVCKKRCNQTPQNTVLYMQYIKININEVDLYKTCKDYSEYSPTSVEYILNSNCYHQIIAKCFCIYYYTHLHVSATYVVHLQGDPSMIDVYSI